MPFRYRKALWCGNVRYTERCCEWYSVRCQRRVIVGLLDDHFRVNSAVRLRGMDWCGTLVLLVHGNEPRFGSYTDRYIGTYGRVYTGE